MAEVASSLKIGVLGPGAVGSLIAALFWRLGSQVVCVGTSRAVESIKKDGIHVSSPVYGDFVAHPEANLSLVAPVDILFIAVKSPYLREALFSITDGVCDATSVVPLLNGLGHREEIRRQLGDRVVVGTIGAVEVALSENRTVKHRSPMRPHIEIASDCDVSNQTLQSVRLGIEASGISVSIAQTENAVIWRKLVRLCAIATMTTFSQSPIGQVRSDIALRAMLENIVKEVADVAFTEGVSIQAEQVIRQIDDLPATLTTSLQRDVFSGLPSEIEAIIGNVLRLGKSRGLSMHALEIGYSSIMAEISL